MVYGFIIHSAVPLLSAPNAPLLEKDGSAPPSTVDVYLSHFYEPMPGEASEALAQAVATQAAKMNFETSNYDKPVVSKIRLVVPKANNPDKPSQHRFAQSKNEGMFYLPKSSLVESPKIVLWRRQDLVMYTLLCFLDESRLLGSSFLSMFPALLSEHVKNPALNSQPREIMARPDDVLLLAHQFLPNGQLLFTSPEYVKQLKKETETGGTKS